MTKDEIEQRALARFHVVSTVLQPEDPTLTKRQLCERAARKGYILPDGSPMKFSAYTVDRWTRTYTRYGFEGLKPKMRNDKGSSRKMTAEIMQRIADKIEEYPRMPATVIYASLADEGLFTEDDLSLSTVSRFVSEYKKEAGDRLLAGQREKRRYEKAHINEVWYGDTTYSVHIRDEKGKKRQVYIIALIDDASRLIVSCRAFFQDNTQSLISVLEGGLRRYGKPQLLSFDNGRNYRNSQIRLLAGRCGISLNYAPPYTPQSKGKIERFFNTLKTQWQSGLSADELSCLEALNASLDAYILRYNNTVHSSLDEVSPMERFFQEAQLIKTLPDSVLETLFYYEDKRKVSNDGLIKLNGTYYEADYRFARKEVTIRYEADFSRVWIEEDERFFELHPLNKVENGDMKRRTFKLSEYAEEDE